MHGTQYPPLLPAPYCILSSTPGDSNKSSMFYSTVELADILFSGTPVNNTQGLLAGQWSGNEATDVGMVRQGSLYVLRHSIVES